MGREIALLRVATPEAEQRDQLAHQVNTLRNTVLHLERGLEHSRDIGVAMGILMATEKVTRQCAFDLLRMTSQHQNRKLYLVAADVLENGALPVDWKPGP